MKPDLKVEYNMIGGSFCHAPYVSFKFYVLADTVLNDDTLSECGMRLVLVHAKTINR